MLMILPMTASKKGFRSETEPTAWDVPTSGGSRSGTHACGRKIAISSARRGVTLSADARVGFNHSELTMLFTRLTEMPFKQQARWDKDLHRQVFLVSSARTGGSVSRNAFPPSRIMRNHESRETKLAKIQALPEAAGLPVERLVSLMPCAGSTCFDGRHGGLGPGQVLSAHG
jgi:hypothetical protein